MFGIHAADGWWGDSGVEFDDSWTGDELAARIEVYLDGIQDTLVRVVNGSWPDLGVRGLAFPWVHVSTSEISFGFGSVECAPISLHGYGKRSA